MSNILIIDTSKQNTYISLIAENKRTAEVLDRQNKVSEDLLQKIECILTSAGITLDDLNYIGVVIGPGSFTGLRVGIATVKAFAQAKNIKVIALNSFEVLENVISEGNLLIKCTNSSVYYGHYIDGKIESVGVVDNTKISDLKGSNYYIEGEECYIGASELTCYVDRLNEAFLAIDLDKKCIDYTKLEPYYVQLSQAEQALKDKENKNE